MLSDTGSVPGPCRTSRWPKEGVDLTGKRVGIIGTGAISHMHARAYRNIGYRVTACNDISREAGEKFAAKIEADAPQTLATTLRACLDVLTEYELFGACGLRKKQ